MWRLYRWPKSLICYAFFLFTLSISLPTTAQEIAIRIASPDTFLDSMAQDIEFTTSMNEWRVNLRGSSRLIHGGGYSGLDKASVGRIWEISDDSSVGLLVGSDTISWSPWQGNSVVLSDNAPGFPQIRYIYEKKPVSFEKVVGRLSGEDRFLAAHRLRLEHQGLTAGLGEGVVANRKFVDNLATWVPWPYYWTQWAHLQSKYVANDDVNAFAFVQGSYETPNGWLIAAEIMVDDMPHWIGVTQMFQMAGQARLEVPVTQESQLAVQYARANNYTYAFQASQGDYTHHGYCLGSPFGPDNDELLVTYEFPRTRWGFTAVGLSLRRQGEGTYGDVWEHEGYEASKDKTFLSGTVEHTQLVFAKASYGISDNLELNVSFGVGPVQNAKNRPGYNKVHPEGAIEIRYHINR